MKHFEILLNVHQAILKQTRGCPKEIAEHLAISRSCLYRNIDELITMGAIIKYSRELSCFKYENDFTFKLTLQTNEMNLVYGGKNKTFNLFTSVPKNGTEDFYFSPAE